jgi:hypothetical protein
MIGSVMTFSNVRALILPGVTLPVHLLQDWCARQQLVTVIEGVALHSSKQSYY